LVPARTTAPSLTRSFWQAVQSGGERHASLMIYTAYVIEDNNGHYYKGVTNNLERRIKEHRRGKTRTTKKMRGIKVVHTEKFNSFEEARKRELYFKSAAGRRYLKKVLLGR